MDRDALAREAKALIGRIAATPRAAGSESEARARQLCAQMLRENGFTVTEEPFKYSAFHGRWAVPLLGLLFLSWFVFVGSQVNSHPYGAATSFLPILLLLAALGYTLARMVPASRRSRGTNLAAVRGPHPSLWLVAHLDSKSQPVPMLVRIAGIIAVALAFPVMIVAGFLGRRLDLPVFFWLLLYGVGAAGSLAMVLSVVGNRSPGALDNATGVAAALLTAIAVPREASVAVLLTSAEELGLQGARAWALDAGQLPGFAINFDSLDDVGTLTCMANPDSPLVGPLRLAASRAGSNLAVRRVLPGIMVDSTALNRSGWNAVTIAKGNFSTLARIHTSGDTAGRLDGGGVAEAVEMVANFIKSES